MNDIYKVLSLHYLHLCLFLLWDNFKSRCFLARGFVFVLLCSFTKKKIEVFFMPSVTPLSTMLGSRAVMYPERGTLLHISRSGYT